MQPKLKERAKAIKLRKQGYSYSEISQIVSVSQASLSLWLKLFPLNQKQKDRFKKKVILNGKLGAKAKRKQRIEKVEKIRKCAISEIKKIRDREIFYMGIMLYWAEGTKSRGRNISQGVDFSNSDPKMCKFFLHWLQVSLGIKPEEIIYCIYIHESQKNKSEKVLDYWSKIVDSTKEKFNKICYTKTVYPRKNKRKDSGNYYGQLRIKVRKSTDLNRKISGWVDGICIKSGAWPENKV